MPLPESYVLHLAFAVLIGMAIGLERESSQISKSGESSLGVRTFSLIGLIGGISGLLYFNAPIVSLVIAGCTGVLILIYYGIGSALSKDYGLTTELALILALIFGFLLTTELISVHITIALAVVLTLVLSVKKKVRALVAGVEQHELNAFIGYAIVALVVLPFLPNHGFTLSDIPVLQQLIASFGGDTQAFATLELFNPRKVWFIVVLVTGIDVIGYILAKIVGHKRSFALTSFIGGFVSSTSTTQALAQKSKTTTAVQTLAGAAILANAASFLQIFLLVGPINPQWLVAITPALATMILSAGVICWVYMTRLAAHQSFKQDSRERKKIFSLGPALTFAGIIILVKLITRICLVLFGQSGFVISSIIASFAGIDAIVISLADMAGKSITFEFALLTFLLVNATNLISKSIYSFVQGKRQFALLFLGAIAVIITLSFAGLLFV
ncbi:MAG: DUF4010 domain-containing protein [Patescibacteria group bacterium]